MFRGIRFMLSYILISVYLVYLTYFDVNFSCVIVFFVYFLSIRFAFESVVKVLREEAQAAPQ
jgi:hypothetical protein